MADQETIQVIQDIINRAQEGRAFPFRTIIYWSEFQYFKGYARSNKLIIKLLRTSADNLFKEYCRDVTSGISEVAKLLAYSQLLDIVAFYENDLKILKQMADEYDEYLGNFSIFWNSFLGGRRDI